MTLWHRAVLPLLAALIAALLAYVMAERIAQSAVTARLDQSLLLTSRAVMAEIDRFRALPDVAGEDARIRAALADPRAVEAANRYLETVAAHAGAAELFLINAQGITIASSNWAREGSFVGQDYSFRPYFTQAMQAGRGQFYAIGVTTGVPGYFLATRITSGMVGGVLVVKVDLRPLEATWRKAGLMTALADGDGVIFLSGPEDWLYRPLRPLLPMVLSRLAEERTYVGIDLGTAPPLLTGPTLPKGAQWAGGVARLADLPDPDWQLLAAAPTGPVTAVAMAWALGAAALALVLAGMVKAWDQRRQIIALRLSQSEKLEAMVTARTFDLAREVEARRQAETDLRAAQEHLIHAEKMAALGRMSTAIVHEISQPLAAMEATLTAAEMTLAPDESRIMARLATAKGLIRRMQRTTKHLKSFGRKEAGALSLIDLGPVVTSAIELVTPRARTVGVAPSFAGGHAQVMAGAVRMEQVLVNLLINALDAVEGRGDAQIAVTLAVAGGKAYLRVTDTGHGIAPDDLARVTEPFFSTKISGEGLGLGLSISRAILAEFGGDLSVASTQGQGTCVTVSLPLAEAQMEAAQ
jgi:two-component system, NtrC family, C4-dicarboxylate transport sensor histidine kinase DctB